MRSFFDGSEENYALLEDAFRRFPQCTFLGFQFDLQETYHTFSSLFPEHPNWRHEWHNTGRMLSWFYSNTEYLFFLDCDEIVNQEQFSLWLQHADLQNYSAHRFAMFWHFREARFVALAQNDLSLLVKKEFGSFSQYMWGFVHGKAIDGKRGKLRDIPAITKEAESFSKDLKKRGFKFLGPTVVYAHMQAVGMANDHVMSCFRYKKIHPVK